MTHHDIEPAPKPVPRTEWATCAICWCIVGSLENHHAAVHAAAPTNPEEGTPDGS